MSSRRPAAPRTSRPSARPVSRSTPSAQDASARRTSPGTARANSRAARSTSGNTPASARPAKPRSRPREQRGSPDRERPTRRRIAVGRRQGDSEPRPTITLRALVLMLVGLVAFIVLAPTLRYAIAQQEDLRKLNADLAEARERTAALEEELALWDDPDYVRSQARDRLGYVAPGETPYVVVDPETIVGEEAEAAREEETATPQLEGPWYLTVLESVQTAGEMPADGEPDPDAPLIVPEGERP